MSACTSPMSGRLPSRVTVTEVPDTGCGRWSRNRPEGSATPSIPLSCNRKQPTSSAAPKRFFTPRTIRSADERSPSKCSTTSTRCSSERGPAMAPSLVTWPTRMIATPVVLAAMRQRGGDRPDLGDAAGDAVGLGGRHGLHRVDDDERRLHLFDVAERGLQVGLGGEEDLVVGAAGALGAQPDLARRLLARQVERAATGLRPAVHDLEQQRRLADPGIAGQQRHRAGDEAAAEHPVELTDAGGEVPGRTGIDRADGDRGRARGDGAAGGRTRDRGEDRDLVDGAPAAAVRTAADPLRGDVLALRTAVLRTRLGTDLCHVLTVSVGTDRTAAARLSGRPCRLRRPPRPLPRGGAPHPRRSAR